MNIERTTEAGAKVTIVYDDVAGMYVHPMRKHLPVYVSGKNWPLIENMEANQAAQKDAQTSLRSKAERWADDIVDYIERSGSDV